MPDKNVLVVGGAGYIGSHMVQDLLQAGYGVVVLDNLSKGYRDAVHSDGIFFEGDLGDSVLLNHIFSNHRISAVLHFAAYSLVGESVEKPLAYYRNNVSRTIELVDTMLCHDVKHFIFSSTAAVYGEPVKIPISEDHPCEPTNPYGATKLAVERMLADCSRSGLKYISLRYFNAAGADISGTLGERHVPETHLIPLILQVATGARKNVQIFGMDYPTPDGTCIRDYIHVSDLVHAHLLALESLFKGSDSDIYNLGNSTGLSVRNVIDAARAVTGHPIPVVTASRRAGDPAVLIADSGKIRRKLGWRPRHENIKTIIETAWAWHRHARF